MWSNCKYRQISKTSLKIDSQPFTAMLQSLQPKGVALVGTLAQFLTQMRWWIFKPTKDLWQASIAKMTSKVVLKGVLEAVLIKTHQGTLRPQTPLQECLDHQHWLPVWVMTNQHRCLTILQLSDRTGQVTLFKETVTKVKASMNGACLVRLTTATYSRRKYAKAQISISFKS